MPCFGSFNIDNNCWGCISSFLSLPLKKSLLLSRKVIPTISCDNLTYVVFAERSFSLSMTKGKERIRSPDRTMFNLRALKTVHRHSAIGRKLPIGKFRGFEIAKKVRSGKENSSQFLNYVKLVHRYIFRFSNSEKIGRV